MNPGIQSPSGPAAPRSSWPFVAVLIVEVLFAAVLVVRQRTVVGHDAFQYFGLQYYFLNNAVHTGETAQWMPFMTHGTVGNWWYSIQAGLVQSALLAVGPLLKPHQGADFLVHYYGGLLFDQAVLLLGVCLLARRFFRSDWTVLFVAVTSLGSTIPFTQPWYGLHFHYALPLIFEFLHRLFEERRWRWAGLAGTLLAMQGLGNLPYQLPMIALTVLVYLAAYVALYRAAVLEAAKELRSRWPRGLLAAAGVAVVLGLVLTVLKAGTSEIANYNVGRNSDGTVISLDSFLTYGNNRWTRYFEALTRVSIFLDYSIYYGVLAAGFTALSLLGKPSRPQVLLLIPTVALFLVSLDGPVSAFCYYAFPMMKYYRHLALASVIVRMLLAFLAGFGFERMLRSLKEPSPGDHRRLFRVSLVLAAAGVLLLVFAGHPRAPEAIQALGDGLLPEDPPSMSSAAIRRGLLEGAAGAIGAAVLLASLAFPRFHGRWTLPALILFQALDLYGFKAEMAAERTLPLTPQQGAINRLQPAPYSPRRAAVAYDTHPRASLAPQLAANRGWLYWSTDTYLFLDPPSNLGRTDHWLKPYDEYLRAMHRDSTGTSEKPTAYQAFRELRFPAEVPAARKLSGVTEDKIQFFTDAHAADDRRVGEVIGRPGYPGDLLFVHPVDDPVDSGPDPEPDRNERVSRAHRVTRFDANAIEIEVDRAQTGDWLYYAEVWHPNWSATVNGRAVPVHRANLAYQAVQLQGGVNTVLLRYDSPGFALSSRLLNLLSLAWCLFLARQMAREVRAVLRHSGPAASPGPTGTAR